MNNTMEYKGYVGSVEFSEEDGVFFGTVQAIRSLISYEGTNSKELVADFHAAVDDYLELCQKELEKRSFRVLRHSLIPPNDGGIALGQALSGMVHLNGTGKTNR